MNEMKITHNDLPEAISEVLKRISRIEEIIATPSAPEQGDELLNAKQAAEFIQKALPTLYGLVSKRKIPHLKKGKHLMFYRSELMEYLNSGRRKTGQEEVAATITKVDELLAKAIKTRKRSS